MGIYAGIHVVVKVAGEGLIDLLITVATPSSLVVWRAGVVVRMSFVVASRSSIEVRTSSLRSGALGTVMLVSSVMARAAATS